MPGTPHDGGRERALIHSPPWKRCPCVEDRLRPLLLQGPCITHLRWVDIRVGCCQQAPIHGQNQEVEALPAHR
jgi:hypothetical protein